jgi:hypothetical protein
LTSFFVPKFRQHQQQTKKVSFKKYTLLNIFNNLANITVASGSGWPEFVPTTSFWTRVGGATRAAALPGQLYFQDDATSDLCLAKF